MLDRIQHAAQRDDLGDDGVEDPAECAVVIQPTKEVR